MAFKIIILNNDLRIFWKGRINYLHQFLASKDIELYALELFGKGSPYSFDSYTNDKTWWSCLFPDNDSGELSKKLIAHAVFTALDKIKPDIVIASSIVFYAGALGMRWAKKNAKKFVMFDDAKPWQVKRNFLVQAIKNALIKQADALWLPSPDYNDAYRYMQKAGTDFFYGYNCIDNDLFKRAGINTLNHGNILCVARLVPIKNIENLLRAWQLIEQRNSNYKLVIVGSGPEAENLLALAKTLELNRVDFAGSVNNNDIDSYYKTADVLVLPSLSETWGLVVNEAMASGLPVLLSNKVNASESLLQEGINGFGFEPTDVNQMADTMLNYIGLKQKARQKMATASLNIIDNMSYAKMSEQLIAIIPKIMSKKFSAPRFIGSVLINNWYGRYNTSGWDKL